MRYLRKATILAAGANKPFLALVVLDLGNLLGEYGIKVATFNSAGNKKTHLRFATDNQVEQWCEEKVDWRRFVGLDKVLPLGKIIAWYVNVTATGWVPQAIPTARFFRSIKQCLCHYVSLRLA